MAYLIEFDGKIPQVAEGVFLAENAVLVGDVTVGRDSSVWYGAVLRGDMAPITVGEGTSIQDNATVHTEIGHAVHIGSNVTVGHNAVVHCAEVGDNALVGMGSRLLNGAVIGAACIIGAGAVVKENAVVPAGTLMVGVPAKPVRAVTEEQRRFLEQPSPYVALKERYLAQGL